jgi:hypothetical protein
MPRRLLCVAPMARPVGNMDERVPRPALTGVAGLLSATC